MGFAFAPNVSIFVVRLWDVILKTVPLFLLGLAIFHRKRQEPGLWVLLGLWTFLFLHSGPIYTPLVFGHYGCFSKKTSFMAQYPHRGNRRLLADGGSLYLGVCCWYVGCPYRFFGTGANGKTNVNDGECAILLGLKG